MRHLALLLSRIDQSVEGHEDQLDDAVRAALARAGEFSVECLPTVGRWDNLSFCAFEPGHELADWLNLMPSFESLKKMDVQYATAPDADVERFLTALKGTEWPLLFLSYLRVRDEVAFAHGIKALETLEARLRSECSDEGNQVASLVSRPQGWADFALLILGRNVETILDRAGKCWALSMGDLASKEGESWLLESAASDQPAFSRSFSVLAYRPEGLSQVEGTLYGPCIHLRTRPGSDAEIVRLTGETPLTFTDSRGDRTTLKPTVLTQVGTDDAVIRLPCPRGNDEILVPASDLLRWYTSELLPGIRHLLHASELRLGLRPDSRAATAYDPPRVAPVRFPCALIDSLHRQTTTRPLAGALCSMSRMINWGMNHDALYRSMSDLYVHTQALAETLREKHRLDQILSPSQRFRLSELASLFSEALAQRLQGSYYDMMSDSPEVVLELSSNMTQAGISLSCIHEILLGAVSIATGSDPRAYWLVSKEGEPGVCDPFEDLFVFRISSSALQNLRVGLYAVGHEIGHAAFDLHLRLATDLVNEAQALSEERGRPFKPDLPPWMSTLYETPPSPYGAFVRHLYSQLYADAFSCLVVLDGEVSHLHDGLAEVAQAWVQVDLEDPTGLCEIGLRMMFGAWMTSALQGDGSIVDRFARSGAPALPTPQTDEEAFECAKDALRSCDQLYGRAASSLAGESVRLLHKKGFLTPRKFDDYNSLFRWPATALLSFVREDESPMSLLHAEVRWLRDRLQRIRSSEMPEAHAAAVELYDRGLALLADRLEPLRR